VENHAPHNVVWFDVPVADLDRAIAFYSAVLGKQMDKQVYPGMAMGILPHEGDIMGGCLYECQDNAPSDHGLLLYFNCDGRLDDAISQVEPKGGKVLQPKHGIGPHGFRALVLDSEGNRIALHSVKA
jgi:uncharacterized protein